MTKEARIHNGEITVSPISGVGKKNETRPLCYTILHHTQKSTQKWTKVLNVRPESIKCLEETIGGKLLDIDLGNDFFAFDNKDKATKAKINKWDYIKLNASAHQRKPAIK